MNALENAYGDLLKSTLGVLQQDAARKYEREEENLKVFMGKPAVAGFFYLRKNRFMLVTKVDGDRLFVVPVYDRPGICERDTLVPFPLPGYGDPVAHYGKAKWVRREIVESWKLCRVLEEWRLKLVIR